MMVRQGGKTGDFTNVQDWLICQLNRHAPHDLWSFGRGLRPIKNGTQKIAYVHAQRNFLYTVFRITHCLRGYHYRLR